MKKTLIVLALILSGCSASFQPFPAGVSKQELADALKSRDDNIVALAQALNTLQPKKESAKK
jgi:PBP1b-binding outer membrane lipoprotein LpoB